MRIRAAVADGSDQPFLHKALELDEPRADEVLVRLVSTGVCQTDAHVRRQRIPTPLPIVLGHEGAGVVEAVGSSVDGLVPGDHVVMSYQSCGLCRQCLQGHPAYCDRAVAANFGGSRLDGSSGVRSLDRSEIHGHFFGQSSFATYSLATMRNTVKVPKDVPLEILGPLGCGLQTGAGAVLNSFNLRAGQSLAVLGVGAVGFAAVMAAVAAGAGDVIAVDVIPQRLAVATELGATQSINARDSDVADELRRITGRGVDFVLDTTGRADMLTAAVSALAPLGEVGLVAGGQPDAHVAASALGLGLKVGGIVQGDAVPQLFIPQLIEMYQAGHFPFDRLIRQFAFDDIEAAFEGSASGEVIKPVLQIGEVN